MTGNQIFLLMAIFNLGMFGTLYSITDTPNGILAFIWVMGLIGTVNYATIEVVRSYNAMNNNNN